MGSRRMDQRPGQMAPLRHPFGSPNSNPNASPHSGTEPGELLGRLNEAIGRIRHEASQLVGPEADQRTKRILNLLGVAVEEQVQSLEQQASSRAAGTSDDTTQIAPQGRTQSGARGSK